MEKKKNTVNLNEKNKSYTRVEKNKDIRKKRVEVKKDFSIKDEINGENNNLKKYGMFALGIVLIVCLIFGGVKLFGKNDKKESPKKEEQKEVVPKDITPEQPIVEEDDDEIDNYITYVSKPSKEEDKETEELIYRLSYVTNNDQELESSLFEATEKTVEPKMPTKEGWIFNGWYKDAEFSEEFIYGSYLSSDTTVYAKWIKNVEFIKLVNQEPIVLETIQVGQDETIELFNTEGIVEEGYVPGWFIFDEENGISYEILEGTKLAEDVFGDFGDTIELILSPLKKINVKFLYEKDKESVPIEITTKEVIAGRKIDFTDIDSKISTDYSEIEYYGWAYYRDNSKWDFAIDHVAEVDITEIYLITEKCKIVYKEEVAESETDSTYEEIDTIEYAKDTKIKVLDPEEKEDKEFDGWYIESADGITDDRIEDGYLIDEDIVVIGKWKDIEEEVIPPVLSVEAPVEEELPEDESSEITNIEILPPKEENDDELPSDEITDIVTDSVE